MLDIQIAATKINKYASRESGDTLEVVERPTVPGGFTLVLADGQGSGRAAKTLSNLVVNHCLNLLKSGTRDSAVAESASDHLYAYRYGQVSATLNLVSVDFSTQMLLVSRNNPHPVYLVRPNGEFVTLGTESIPIGLYPRTRPVLHEEPLAQGLWTIAFTDGIIGAGQKYNTKFDLPELIKHLVSKPDITAQTCADVILAEAIKLDKNRPVDDMSVAVIYISLLKANDSESIPRRLSLSIAFELNPDL
jgi:serine phosphatase RsbU (regulator of sigma subunit)